MERQTPQFDIPDETFGTGRHRMTEMELRVLGEQDYCKEMALTGRNDSPSND